MNGEKNIHGFLLKITCRGQEEQMAEDMLSCTSDFNLSRDVGERRTIKRRGQGKGSWIEKK